MKLGAKFDNSLLEHFLLPAFESKAEAHAYWQQSDERKFEIRRFFMYFGAVAFIAHSVLDSVAGGEAAVSLILLRFFCVALMLSLTVLFCQSKARPRNDNLVMAYLMTPALTIIAMTIMVDAGTSAEMYPFGLVILVAYGGAILAPRSSKLITYCIMIYGFYLLSVPFAAISDEAFIVNLFFLTVGLSAICIGVVTRERLQRIQFKSEREMEKLNDDLRNSQEEALAARDAAVKASETQSKFISSMSHELRTPLNAILGFSELILQEVHGPVQPASYREYIEDVNRSGRGLLLNINDLLDVQRLTSGKMSWEDAPFEIDDMIRDAVKMCRTEAEDAEIHVVTEPPAQSLAALGDKQRLTQVVTNLLTNAIKFTDPGGRVVVTQRYVEATGLTITVRDNGMGIAEADLERIKTPFQQGEDGTLARKKGGLGLGLAIVGGIVEMIDGSFEIESTLGEGTTCHVTIPPARLMAESALESVA